MPTFIRKNPIEFSGDLKANKAVNKLLLEQNLVSGFLGPTKKKSEDFDKTENILEELDIQIQAYLPSVHEAFGNDFTTDPFNPVKVYTLLEKAKKQVLKQSFTLDQLPVDDVDSITKIFNSLVRVQGMVDDGLTYIDQRKRAPPPRDLLDPDLPNRLIIVLDTFKDQLDRIIPAIQTQLNRYSSGVAQRGMIGGSNCSCKWNLDEPLRNNPMYQTQKYIF
jgi:hypothetical protein